MRINGLGYLGFEFPRYEEWLTFGPETLGVQIGDCPPDGKVHLRMGDRHFLCPSIPVARDGGYTPQLGAAEEGAPCQEKGPGPLREPVRLHP